MSINPAVEAALDGLQPLVDSCGIPVFQYVFFSPQGDIHGLVCAQDTVFDMRLPVGEESIFQAASLSKPLFAYIVMRMVDRGEIDLDRPIADYTDIDRFEDKEMARRLTPRIVLSHQTGLPNWATSPSSDEWPQSRIVFRYPADSCFAYSGEGYAFLQRAVESIQGQPLDDIAWREVFEPFDMPNTSYDWQPAYDSTALVGFNREGENRGQGRHPRANCAYTLRTNAVEYSHFIKRGLLEGEGLSEKAHKDMFTHQVHAQRYADEPRACDSSVFWCLGFGAVAEREPGRGEWYWHWGDNGNFKALWLLHPDTGEGFVYFSNRATGHDLLEPFLKDLTGEELPLNDWIRN
ncbi:MAG: beta-lactamase family protein [Bacteroidales bacterium]|nr:beta-lactamase family protein [Bacteroidales bacterium]